jgi:alkylation response protein AidB-like acyl-CoA dehydrogenase
MIDIYGLTETAGTWRQKAAALAADVVARHAVDVDTQARFPAESLAALAREGFYGGCIDASFGGQSQGPAVFAAVGGNECGHGTVPRPPRSHPAGNGGAGRRHAAWVLRTRLAALQTAVQVTDLAMKTCGGAAFSRHLGIERLFRDARAGWVMAPTVDHLADFIGRTLTGLPLL